MTMSREVDRYKTHVHNNELLRTVVDIKQHLSMDNGDVLMSSSRTLDCCGDAVRSLLFNSRFYCLNFCLQKASLRLLFLKMTHECRLTRFEWEFAILTIDYQVHAVSFPALIHSKHALVNTCLKAEYKFIVGIILLRR